MILWSTGFIGARLSAPYADPLTFLSIRLFIVALILMPLALLLKQPFPKQASGLAHASMIGLLIHGVYLGCVFYVVRQGFPIALTALIVGLQPLLTAIFAVIFLRESLTKNQWFGLTIGFLGIVVVLYPAWQSLWDSTRTTTLDLGLVGLVFLSLLGITIGTVYQKHYGKNMALIPATVIQYFSASVCMFVVAYAIEDGHIEWNGQVVFAMVWLVFVLSIGAVLLFLLLLKHSATASVTSLFYLTPALVAIEGYMIFDERLELSALWGLVLSLLGVFMVIRAQRKNIE